MQSPVGVMQSLAAPAKPQKLKAMHYSGKLEYTTANGQGVSILGGYAACMRGARTIRARSDGNVSLTASAVTCKRCMKLMAMAAAR